MNAEMFSIPLTCFPLLLGVVAEGALQLHKRMFACCKCAQWNLCHVGLDFTKLPLPKRLFSLLVFPQFELNSFFRFVLYLPGTEGKKLSTGFAGFCVSFAV